MVQVATKEDLRHLISAETSFTISMLKSAEAPDRCFGTQKAGGATAILSHYSRSPIFNRIMGANQEFSEKDLSELDQFYELAARDYVIEIYPADYNPLLLQKLHTRNFSPLSFHSCLYAFADDLEPEPTHHHIRKVKTDNDLDQWREIVRNSFPHANPEADDEIQRFVDLSTSTLKSDHWDHWIIDIGGTPVSCASLYRYDNIGCLAGGYTIPEGRNKGCQSELLHHRIDFARQAGCRLICGQTQPGTTSQRNMERAGLRTAITKSLWLKRKT